MIHKEIKKVEELVTKCHELGGPVLLDHADYLQDILCRLKLSANLEPTQDEWNARKRWDAKYNTI
tara:strand:+ start:580 stop:774 length:195 start_codon:yes stop_codon:yes gene_type:complete